MFLIIFLSTFVAPHDVLYFLPADLPDDDLVVLDEDNNGVISASEFLSFFEKGMKFATSDDMPPPPPPPIDDLLYKAADLEGMLTVKVRVD